MIPVVRESLMQVSTGSVWVGEVTLPEAKQEVNKHTEKLLYRTTSRATAIQMHLK